jgi:hypothetical protein
MSSAPSRSSTDGKPVNVSNPTIVRLESSGSCSVRRVEEREVATEPDAELHLDTRHGQNPAVQVVEEGDPPQDVRQQEQRQVMDALALGARESFRPERQRMLGLDDGIEGVVVTPAHARLHAHLKELAARGVLLALVSRNEPEDVERLFAARRTGYGLALNDFVAVEVSWGSKADAVRCAAAAARIGEDAVVFVDDNPGELLTVGLQFTDVALVHARADADGTVEALHWQPGLWRWTGDDVASVRAGDLAANATRTTSPHHSLRPEKCCGHTYFVLRCHPRPSAAVRYRSLFSAIAR